MLREVKFLRSVALVAVCSFAFAACGSSSSDDGEGATASAPAASATPNEESATPTEDAAAGPTIFTSTVAPDKDVKAGTKLTSTSTGAPADTDFYCVLSVLGSDEAGAVVSATNTRSVTKVTSDAKGSISCEHTYEPYSAVDPTGVELQCPVTPAQAKDGFTCAIALADVATSGIVAASYVPFATAS